MEGARNTKPTYDELSASHEALKREHDAMKRRLDWLTRQVFGSKSERRLVEPPASQPLLDGFAPTGADETRASADKRKVSYERRVPKRRPESCVTDEGLRFDDTVPKETIRLSLPQESEDAFEVISEQFTYRLAQRPASYVVLEYVQPVVKRKADGHISSVPAPSALWPGSMADVSVVAGLLVDKFNYHLPLNRQHQRIQAAGITISRSTLTHWVHRAAKLLAPIADAQLRAILRSKTLAIDETPIRAGRSKAKRGKLNTGWYWPVYGEADEVSFTFSPSRGRAHLDRLLVDWTGTLLTDGAPAYASYQRARPDIVHAQCWAHTRRQLVAAEGDWPTEVAEALELIGALYAADAPVREGELTPAQALAQRVAHALPAADAFFAWCDAQAHRMDLVPQDPLTKAVGYAREREGPLRVFLGDPTVAIDTNHLERALRCVPMGRSAWMFCWTEVGAEVVGTVQSLIATCRLHGINPYTYLVDVLQRIAIHPDSAVEDLTPRRWKELFASDPLISDLELATRNRPSAQ